MDDKPANDAAETAETPLGPKNGRRLLRDSVRASWRWLRPDDNDTSRLVKMAARAVRRAPIKPGEPRRLGRSFRAVYGHAIPAPQHKDHIMTLRVMDRTIKTEWLRLMTVAKALVAWGRSMKETVAEDDH